MLLPKGILVYNVFQHWDPLRVCVVGRSYPPEFYSWIQVPHVRSLFERIAIETEEDFQNIIRILESFGVRVLRPHPVKNPWQDGRYISPPMNPRDEMVMVGNRFYMGVRSWQDFYQIVRGPDWPEQCDSIDQLPKPWQDECRELHGWPLPCLTDPDNIYRDIFQDIQSQGNEILPGDPMEIINGAMIARIGRDLYFGTDTYHGDLAAGQARANALFPEYRNHIVNTGGHSDGTYCPVCPGLIVSLRDVDNYQETYPGWEVVYLPNQSWGAVKPFLDLKQRTQGKWWIPGFEYDQDVINTVETWLGNWTGYVEETVFDVNMLMIDPKNVMVSNYNKLVFDALARYGITPHIAPLRHRYFWDGGIHCVTTDLHRDGVMQDYFPERG